MTKTTTISEALAERKVIAKRIESKQAEIIRHVARQDALRDPLIKEGGQEKYVREEMQALRDLREQLVSIARAIAVANVTTTVTAGGSTRTIADWLTWRRDVAPGERTFLAMITQSIDSVRRQAVQRGGNVVGSSGDNNPMDWVINVSETELSRRREELEALHETLDGQLSVKNATVMVTY